MIMLIAFLMASIPTTDNSIETVVNSSLSHSKGVFSKSADELGQHIPKYEPGIESKTAREFASINDADLNQKGQDAIEKTPIISDVIKKNPLPNYENLKLFKRAESIYADPAAMLEKLLEDCSEKINTPDNQYTKSRIKKDSIKTIEEQKSCERPADNLFCEKTLKVECEVPQPCDLVGIKNVTGNISIDWNSETGILTASSGWKGRHSCHTYNYYINFEIEDKKRIKEFKLTNVTEDDHIQIKVNDTAVYTFPGGGPCELGAVRSQAPNVDLTSYLKDGQNQIQIVLTVGGYGLCTATFKVSAEKKCCDKFKDEWVMRCWVS